MAKTFKIKRNDLQPYYRFSIPDASDLTGATFTCTMVHATSGDKKIDTSGTGCVITDAAAKECEYQWQAGDTNTEGLYKIEFEFTPVAGGKFTVPIDKPAIVQIIADLNAQ